MPILFGPEFLTNPAHAGARELWRARLAANDVAGSTRAAGGVIGRASVEAELDRIRLPTLIVVGADDRATPLELSLHLHERIAGSRMVVISGAGHSAPIEQPQAVNEALLA